MRTNLQIPMDKSLRDNAAAVAVEHGFSSLQDAVRVFITQLAQKRITITINPNFDDEILTRKQETILTKKYQQAIKEIKAGKAYIAESSDQLIDKLNSS